MKTLKTDFEDELERLRSEGHERMRRRKTAPARNAACRGSDESSGEHRFSEGCNTSSVNTDCCRTKTPGGAAGSLRRHGGNTGRGSPGDEPGGVRPQGKALESRNPMSVSGMKQGRRDERRENPRGSAKGRGGKVVRVEPGIGASSSNRFAGLRTLKGRRTSREEPEGAIGSLLS